MTDGGSMSVSEDHGAGDENLTTTKDIHISATTEEMFGVARLMKKEL